MASPDYLIRDAANRAAYVALATRLAKTIDFDLVGLAEDLELLIDVQPDPAWRDQLVSLGAALLVVAQQQSASY